MRTVFEKSALLHRIEASEPSTLSTVVDVASRADLLDIGIWQSAFQSYRKDRRYYEIVEDTICPDFAYRYCLLRDEGGSIRAVQPFFIVDQDLLAGVGRRSLGIVKKIRRFWPRFLTIRTMMIGCVAGEGHLYATAPAAQRRDAEILAAHIVEVARRERAPIIVLKEFPAQYRDTLSCFLTRGFTRVPSMPMTRLDLSSYSSFEDYFSESFKSKRRNEFRRKFKAAEQAGPISLEITSDISGMADELYPLYLQVYERAKLKFEKLTKDFFCQIGTRMGDKARFFIWRQDGKAIAFSLCLTEGNVLYGEYIGLDYNIALKLHFYFYAMRDMIAWAVSNGYKSVVSSGLSYPPKLQMRHVLEPLDLYIRHTSPILNPILRALLPWLEPTRSDRTLKQFPNFNELWAGPRQHASIAAKPASASHRRAARADHGK